jgi:hypothetical protein
MFVTVRELLPVQVPETEVSGGDTWNSRASWTEFKPMISQMDRLLDDHYRHKNHKRVTMQVKIYNFLERPTGWKCFVYHFTV